MRKRTIGLLVISVLLVGALFVLAVRNVENNKDHIDRGTTGNKVVNAPTNLLGEWHQTKSGIPDIVMDASINPNSIQINMTPQGSTNSSIYWLGTFDTSKNSADSFDTTSLGDQDAMQGSIFASLDDRKLFTYKNGDLSFKFTMMGTTTTVHLAK